ncbi:hypothetical protein B0T22DRAFT_438985 [Podospora appendiculata]|uniref:Uncharacterized protein n=1 Tax=Podospora appendiculata TaxID=314037 RepID=A0AAE0X7P2_9PEZI|nr:hypothetical protein B0T22DRAFT_438985 [Podospora appendiculata]
MGQEFTTQTVTARRSPSSDLWRVKSPKEEFLDSTDIGVPVLFSFGSLRQRENEPRRDPFEDFGIVDRHDKKRAASSKRIVQLHAVNSACQGFMMEREVTLWTNPPGEYNNQGRPMVDRLLEGMVFQTVKMAPTVGAAAQIVSKGHPATAIRVDGFQGLSDCGAKTSSGGGFRIDGRASSPYILDSLLSMCWAAKMHPRIRTRDRSEVESGIEAVRG